MQHANISWITDTLATGGDLSYDPEVARLQVAEMVEAGIVCVIDCRAEVGLGGMGEDTTDRDIWEEVGITYVHAPTDDREGHHIPEEVFDKAVLEARHHLDADEKVLVHCHMGINRGPSVAYAVMLDLDWDPIKAFDLIREKREQAAIYYAVDALEAELSRRDFHHPVDVDRLKAHMRSIWTDEERARIQHVIRAGHQADREVYAKVNGY
jgi:dual specificity phosphatase 3